MKASLALSAVLASLLVWQQVRLHRERRQTSDALAEYFSYLRR